MSLKTLSTRVPVDKYKVVVDCIEQIKVRENINISLSQFVWKAIKYFIKVLRTTKYTDL